VNLNINKKKITLFLYKNKGTYFKNSEDISTVAISGILVNVFSTITHHIFCEYSTRAAKSMATAPPS